MTTSDHQDDSHSAEQVPPVSQRERVRTALGARPQGSTARQLADITGLKVEVVGSVLSKMFYYGEAARQGASGHRLYAMTAKGSVKFACV